MKRKFVFWLEFPLMHMAPLIKELSLQTRVIVFFEKEIPRYRKEQGFVEPDFGEARLLKTPQDYELKNRSSFFTDKFFCNPSQFIHIFHGFDYCKRNYYWLKKLSKISKNCFIQAEARAAYGLKGRLRLLKAQWLAFRWKDEVAGILALGQLGVQYYKKAGFRADSIIEWGYFGPESMGGPLDSYLGRSIDLLYVGGLNKGKNVPSLLCALAMLNEKSKNRLTMTIVGDGPEKMALKELVRDLEIETQVLFLGMLSNSDVAKELLKSKVLVLPSYHDGWGYVVNEATAFGCCVLISEQCGSASCFTNSFVKGLNQIIIPQSVRSIANAINRTLVGWNESVVQENTKLFNQKFSAKAGVERLKVLINESDDIS